jgi:hypothetical protein
VSKKIVNQLKSAESAIKKCGIRDSEPKTSICRKSKPKIKGKSGEIGGFSGDFRGISGDFRGKNSKKKEEEKEHSIFLPFYFLPPIFSPIPTIFLPRPGPLNVNLGKLHNPGRQIHPSSPPPPPP